MPKDIPANALKRATVLIRTAHAIISAALQTQRIESLTDKNFVGANKSPDNCKMDKSNSTRFRSTLDDLDIPLTRQLIHLPKRISNYHQSEMKRVYTLYNQTKSIQQDYKTSITAHIDAFTALKHDSLTEEVMLTSHN
ncbi:hypothetical protein KEM48_009300 [Puccinia striiformis f. sp. tritici PST-130]|nr:hypothetical protein KEM48_009300 [Puccinia striiformis f. sp. tritici PST-130]